jgi:HTH-type transcriptional regulator / antitoxin HigA
MGIGIQPISNEQDYEAAVARAESLMDAEPGTPEDAELDALVTLIQAYEDRHFPMGLPDPIDAIRIRMDEKKLRPRDLEVMIGSRARVSEILSRKRALTLPMIRRLSKGLDIPAEILIQEIKLERSSTPSRRQSVPDQRRSARATRGSA